MSEIVTVIISVLAAILIVWVLEHLILSMSPTRGTEHLFLQKNYHTSEVEQK